MATQQMPWDNDPIVGKAAPNGQPIQAQPFPGGTPPMEGPMAGNPGRRSGDATAQARLALEKTGKDLQAKGLDNTITNTIFDNEAKLRSEYQTLPPVKAYRDNLPNMMTALTSAPTPTGDSALIYMYAKVMDPLTGVREGEQRSAEDVAPLLDATYQKWKKNVDGGGSLPDDVRDGFRRAIVAKMQNLGDQAFDYRKKYTQFAQGNNLNPAHVVGETDDFAPFKDQYYKARQTLGWDGHDLNSNYGQNVQLSQDKSLEPIDPKMQAEYEAKLRQFHPGELTLPAFKQLTQEVYGKYNHSVGGTDADMQNFVDAYNRGAANLKIPAPEQGTNWWQNAMTGVAKQQGPLASGYAGAMALGNAGGLGIPTALAGPGGKFAEEQMGKEHPVATTVGDLIGSGVTSGLGEAALGARGMGRVGADVVANMGYGAGRGVAEADSGERLRGGAIGGAVGGGSSLAGRFAVRGAKGFLDPETQKMVETLANPQDFSIPSAREQNLHTLPIEFQGMSEPELKAKAAELNNKLDVNAATRANFENTGIDQGHEIQAKMNEAVAGNRQQQAQFLRARGFQNASPEAQAVLMKQAEEAWPTDPTALSKTVPELSGYVDPRFRSHLAPQNPYGPDEPIQLNRDLIEGHLGLSPEGGKGQIPAVNLDTMQRFGLGRAEEFFNGLPGVHGEREAAMASWNQREAARALAAVGVELPKDLAPGHATTQFVHDVAGQQYDNLKPYIKGPLSRNFLNTAEALKAQILSQGGKERVNAWRDVQGALSTLRSNGGTYNGDTLKEFTERLDAIANKLRRKTDGTVAEDDVANAAQKLRSAAMDMVGEQNPAAGRKLKAIDQSWALLSRMRDGAESAEGLMNGGVYSPQTKLNEIAQRDRAEGQRLVSLGAAPDQRATEEALHVLGARPSDKASLKETGVGLLMSPVMLPALAAAYGPGIKHVTRAIGSGVVGDSIDKLFSGNTKAADALKILTTQILRNRLQGN